jgi:hypothetical protein
MKKNRSEILKENSTEKKAEVGGCDIMPYLLSLCKFMNENGCKLEPYPHISLSEQDTYKSDPLGKTAWYNPDTKSITLIAAGRHPKDVLRSAAHELVHHSQNLAGKMKDEDRDKLTDPAYAQKNKNLMKLEADAYLRGNMLMRKWEDGYK